MEITKSLRHEHRDIERMIRLMDTMGDRLQSGDDSIVPYLRKSIDFVRGFADGCHHEKEEQILFPMLEARGVPVKGGPIGVMLHEHDVGRKYIAGLVQGLDRYESGEKAAAGDIIENIRGYTNLLRAHIHKEDMVLFPMAEQVLSEPEKTDLHERMEEAEHKITGKTHHQYIHDIKDIEEALS